MKTKKVAAILLSMAMVLSMTACGSGSGTSSSTDSTPAASSESTASADTESESTAAAADNEAAEEKVFEGLSPFDETVTLTLGFGLDPSTTFEGDETIENNRYLTWIKDDLNIQVNYDWVCSTSDFEQKMNLCIAGNTLPDAMNVQQTQFLAMQSYDQLQPITDVYEEYASDMLKRYVESGGDSLMEAISKDGEMYAIPAPTLTANGVNEMWIRQDWLDELGLDVPTTVDEVMEVAQAFVDNKMGGDNTIGIIGPASGGELVARGGNLWGLDAIFGAFESYPEYWLYDENGDVIYGSVQPETKEALAKLAEMYAAGVIDPEIFVRSDSKEAVIAGQVGIFFGTWSSGFSLWNVIMEASANWQAYLVPLAEDGNFYSPMGDPTTQYVCISKNCEHPEAVIKIINYLIENEQKWVDEGVAASTAAVYPLYNVYDNADEIEYSYEWLKKVNLGEVAPEDVDVTGRKLLTSDINGILGLKLDPKDDFSMEYWDMESPLVKSNLVRLICIMVGERPLVEDGYVPIENIYGGVTDTMSTKWANLQKIEDETFAKIILGQASIDEFDTFVEKWYAEGGQDIINEITEAVGK